MLQWRLHCPDCETDFVHVAESQDIQAFETSGVKSDLYGDGLSVVCPHCKTSHFYEGNQLSYGASA
jgi:hypothetical protein